MADLDKSWQRLWLGLGARGDGLPLHEELLGRYSEPHRKYHTLQHISECIGWFESIAELAHQPAEIEAALWFHDAIYELDRHDNEERSASLAAEALSRADVPIESVARIEHFILATKHGEPPLSSDGQFVVDIDISIFGATEQRFAEYERQIREEYSIVPDDVFNKKRQEILYTFLNRNRIYITEYFHSALEQRARANLIRAIKNSRG